MGSLVINLSKEQTNLIEQALNAYSRVLAGTQRLQAKELIDTLFKMSVVQMEHKEAA